jgi:alpha-tubulin suppressor-like RCC1 family protein
MYGEDFRMKYFYILFSFLFIFTLGCTKKPKKKVDPNAILSISPITPRVKVNELIKLEINATDASFTIISGEGTIGADGSFTAPTTPQTVVISGHGTPPRGSTAVDVTVEVQVYEPLVASISSGTIYQFSETAQITFTGGAAPITIQNSNNLGVVDANNVYSSPDFAGTTILSVVDAAGNTISLDVTVIPRIHITNSGRTAYVGTTVQVDVADGKPPYSYSMVSGSGSVDVATGLFTVGATIGIDIIRATDALGDYQDLSLQILDPLTLDSPTLAVVTGGILNLTAAGGLSPYTFAVTGVGSVQPDGSFTSSQSGNALVTVVDMAGNTDSVSLLVFDPLTITPATKNIITNDSTQFSAAGGVSPLTFSVVNVGGGSINASNGSYLAPASAGASVVRVTDAIGNQADASVTIGIPLAVNPTSATLQINASQGFTGAGGFSPYGYSVKNGGVGSILSNGTYSSAIAGNAIVVVTDVTGATANASVTVFAPLTISPTTKNMLVNTSFKFTGAGGIGSLTYSKVSGGGSINSTTGTYTAPATATTAVVRVNDNAGYTADATINVTPPLTLTAGTNVTGTDTNVAFIPNGGLAPYGFSLQGGSVGTILADGTFFSNNPGNATVTVTDSVGNTASASIIVVTPLAITPTSGSFIVSTTGSFTATGGDTSHAYVFSVLTAGGGAINSANGAYTAPASPITSATIRVTDFFGTTASAVVIVANALSIAPTSITLQPNNSTIFAAAGGFGPYTYSVLSGVGSILNDGTYTSATTGTAVIRVTDTFGGSATANVSVLVPLVISPSTVNSYVNSIVSFTATGGDTSQPYSFSVVSGGGAINSTTGTYVTAAIATTATIRVTDNSGLTSDASVNVADNVSLNPGPTFYALTNNSYTFTASGGYPGYTYSLQGGSVGMILGLNNFSSVLPGTAIIIGTDLYSHTGTTTINVFNPVDVVAGTNSIIGNSSTSITATGGSGTYNYTITSGSGTISQIGNNGTFTAPGAAGSTTITATDTITGFTGQTTITILPPVTISPKTYKLTTLSPLIFSASGGYPGYTYSIQSGNGSITGNTYTAGAASDMVVVKVIDSQNNFDIANVTVEPPISITQASYSLAVNATYVLPVINGFPPYSYSVTGSGSVTNGTYSSASAGSATVTITDSIGASVQSSITIYNALTISPASKNILTNGTTTFSAVGGVAPISFSVVNVGGGTINSSTGFYTAPASPGSAVVRATDSVGNQSDSNVTINVPLSLSSNKNQVVTGGTAVFTAAGGFPSPSYTYTVMGGGVGSIQSNGDFTSAITGTSVIQASDSISTSTATITIYSPLTISPATKFITTNGTFQFSGTGGYGALAFSVIPANGGTIDASGNFTASSTAGTYTIQLTDADSNTANATAIIAGSLILPTPAPYVLTNNNISFVPSGGFPNYAFTVLTGVGSIDPNTGSFSSPTAGTTTVQVTDANSATATSTIKVFAPLTISTTAATHSFVNTGMLFTASGGDTSLPYTFSVVSGGGSMNASTGSYVTAGTATTAIVRVTDNSGLTATTGIIVAPNITLNFGPTLNAITNTSYSFVATGGYPNFTFTLQPGSVGMILAPGDFSSVTTGSAVVIGTDIYGNNQSTIVNVYNPVVLTAGTTSVISNGTTSLNAVGGAGNYTYTISSGSGSVSQSGNNGTFTAPGAAATTVMTATDSVTGFTGQTTITTIPAVSISPKTFKLTSLTPLTFSSTGGFPAYTYTIQSGNGSITGNTYTAGAGSDVVVIKVTDSQNNFDSANITVEPALNISQASYNMAINSTYVLPVANGFPPYSYSISGVGTITSGTFTSAAAGSATVTVTDTTGASVVSNITVFNALTIAPATKNIITNGTTTFTATGGVGTLNFTVVNVGGGTINPTTGFYTAPASAGAATVRVTDGIGNQSDSAVTINLPISLTADKYQVVTGGTAIFTAANGFPSPSYNYSVQSGGVGSILSNGNFTSGANGTAVIIAADALSSTTATITVYNPLAISPSSKSLTTNATFQFTGTGGFGSHNYSVIPANGGTVNASGFFTASTNSGTFTIHLIDSDSNFSDATVYIAGPLSITPSTAYAITNTPMTFNAAGGFPAYSYTILSGPGALSAPGNSYSSTTVGTVSVRVTDSNLSTATSIIKVYEPLLITTAATNTFVGSNINFTATGGDTSNPYSFTILSGGGDGVFTNPTTGAFTTSTTPTTTVVKVTDFVGQTAQMTINVASGLAVNYFPILNTIKLTTSTFSVSGGYPGYTYQILGGVGSINGSGEYISSTTGTASVRVTDQSSNTKTIAINVYEPVIVTAAQTTLLTGGTTGVTSTGGLGPYTYSIQSGGGIVTQSGGNWTFSAPGAADTTVIKATDSLGFSGTTSVTTVLPLAISPSTTTIQTFSTLIFTASGGVPFGSAPFYTYAIVSGAGSIDANSGVYTAPATPGTVTVSVTDSFGYTSTANVTIVGPVEISPTSKTLAINNSAVFSASGGAPPYTFSISSGTGILATTLTSATYTAPGSTGNATVRVQDSIGSVAQASITINPGVSITPSGWTLIINETKGLSASGGVGPYSYSVTAGGASGSVNTTTGTFTATATPGSSTIVAIDSLGNTGTATVLVNAALAISPTTVKVVANGTISFSGSNGVPPYSYAVTFGAGTIDGTGVYTAPSIVNNAVVTISDSGSPVHTTTADVETYMPLTISPTSGTLHAGEGLTFTSTGGWGTTTWSLTSGSGTIDASGNFASPMANEVDVIRITDQLGNYIESTQIIVKDLAIAPTTKTLSVGDSYVFTTTGGFGGIVFSTTAGTAYINSTTGSFVAPPSVGTYTVTATDGNGAGDQSVSNIIVIAPTKVYSGGAHSCVLFNDGSVKCWGDNIYGQLGIGLTTGTIGTLTTHMGDNLPFVTLGTHTAKSLALGKSHTCAILNDDSLKCWGLNSSGQLGLDNTTNTGASNISSQAAINLGSTVRYVSAGDATTCAILNNNTIKCWGSNTYGVLGIDAANSGTTTAIGNESGEMATAGTVLISMGSFSSVSVGLNNACAYGIDGGTNVTKCWGGMHKGTGKSCANGLKALTGSTDEVVGGIGNVGGEMASIQNLNFGTGTYPWSISSAYKHNCTILSSNKVRCWGANTIGELGTDANTDACGLISANWGLNVIGDVNIGAYTPFDISVGATHTCITVTTTPVKAKCWGGNTTGQLGANYATTAKIGFSGGGSIAVSAGSFVALPTASGVSNISAGLNHNCVRLENNDIMCWGSNSNGQLGLGASASVFGANTAGATMSNISRIKLTGQ